MNILIAADYATPGSGNFIASLYELGNALDERGDKLCFIFPKSLNTESEHSWVNWLREKQHSVYLVDSKKDEKASLEELLGIISKHSIDIVHLHFSMYHHVALHYRSQLPVKIVVHDHMDFGSGKMQMTDMLKNGIKSIVYRILNIGIISVNPYKDKSYCFAKHWYIPNGLSLIRFLAKSQTREECRESLGLEPDQKICLFLGWDLHRKGFDIALKAIKICREKDPTVVLAVVGMGKSPGEWIKNYIYQHTDIDPLSPWIYYLPSTEDMFAYHRVADVYLSASRSEAFSYGILEAISENTPIVVSDIPGTRWCYEFEHKIPYPVEDYEACADAILQALSIGRIESNSADIVAKYSIDKWCNEMLGVYDAI